MAKPPDDPRLDLLQGTLDMLILRTLQWGPEHGHGIGQAIRAQSEDLLRVETGSLYPALHRLVKRGWLKAEWGVSEANQRAQVLPADRRGKSTAPPRAGPLVAARPRHRSNHEPGTGGFRQVKERGMRPDEGDLDEEIRGHLAINIKERIDRGEDPVSARRAALMEFGYVPAVRDEMRRVWYSRWYDQAEALARDIRFALRSLARAKALTVTVVVTLALGIGANAAIFSVVRSVLLRPLVNREADRLIYIRQGAQGLGIQNLTFSVPEINDFKSRATTIAAFGDFSTVEFTLIGFAREPRLVRAGVVNGSFFEVMGLRPVLGRLLSPADDGPGAAGAAVLTHRFWKDVLNSDPAVIGQTIRLGSTAATVVGVLEPSVPYPTETEIIANMVTSPHHLGATMNTDRKHRMTDLFGRLAPGASVDAARAELASLHASMLREHPDAYSPQARIRLQVRTLQEQIASPARTILLVLMAAAAVVFIIACSNVANLILARSVRREAELAVRAALGAGRGALRRTLLAESLVLCAAGAGLGLLLAGPLVSVAGRYAARFSVRALESTVDAGVLWLGAGLAVMAAVLLAYIPRLPSSDRSGGLGLAGGGVRITPGTNRRLRIFATTQIACTFVLLAAAGMLVTTLTALQTANTGYDLRHVLAIDLPAVLGPGLRDPARETVLQEVARRIGELPGVEVSRWEGACPGATVAQQGCSLSPRGTSPRTAKKARRVGCDTFPLSTSPYSASRFSRAGTLRMTIVPARSSWPLSTRAWRSGCSRTVTRSTGV